MAGGAWVSFDLALVAFMFATTAAPGPNAALMVCVGARGGIAAGLPVLLGLATANAGMKAVLAASVGALAELDPAVVAWGKWVAAALTLWLAWRLVRRTCGVGRHPGANGFRTAFAFQLVNPKATITGLAAATLFSSSPAGNIAHAATFAAIAFPSVILGSGAWLLVGYLGGARLRTPVATRVLGAIVGVTLVASLVPVLL